LSLSLSLFEPINDCDRHILAHSLHTFSLTRLHRLNHFYLLNAFMVSCMDFDIPFRSSLSREVHRIIELFRFSLFLRSLRFWYIMQFVIPYLFLPLDFPFCCCCSGIKVSDVVSVEERRLTKESDATAPFESRRGKEEYCCICSFVKMRCKNSVLEKRTWTVHVRLCSERKQTKEDIRRDFQRQNSFFSFLEISFVC
jgi:hypothetical protein